MTEMQNQVDQIINELVTNKPKSAVDGRTEMPEESANVSVPRGVAVQIQGLLDKLNRLLHSYQATGSTQPQPVQQSPAVQVTDLPGI